MTESESALLIEKYRDAWDDQVSAEASREVAKLFRAYTVPLVTEVIDDRVEAELPRPGLAELSRVLRVYSPSAKRDIDTTPPQRPANPWARDLPALPFVPPDLHSHMAEMRDAHAIGVSRFEERPRTAPEPPVVEFVYVPPTVRQALREGVEAGAKARRDRRDAKTTAP